MQIIARDSAISVGVLERKGGTARLCLQGSPDTSFDQTSDLNLSASLANFGGGGESEGEGSEEVEMAGRTPALLFAREVFYRTCEAALSSNASPEEWRVMFAAALQASAEVMKLETQNTKVQIVENSNLDIRASTSLPAPPSSVNSTAPTPNVETSAAVDSSSNNNS
jgi:hypothetical protein